MGRGYIFQAANKWDQAAEIFHRVEVQLPDDIDMGLLAKEEHAWCSAQVGMLDDAADELQEVLSRLENTTGHTAREARVWWRLGECYWRQGGIAF